MKSKKLILVILLMTVQAEASWFINMFSSSTQSVQAIAKEIEQHMVNSFAIELIQMKSSELEARLPSTRSLTSGAMYNSSETIKEALKNSPVSMRYDTFVSKYPYVSDCIDIQALEQKIDKLSSQELDALANAIYQNLDTMRQNARTIKNNFSKVKDFINDIIIPKGLLDSKGYIELELERFVKQSFPNDLQVQQGLIFIASCLSLIEKKLEQEKKDQSVLTAQTMPKPVRQFNLTDTFPQRA